MSKRSYLVRNIPKIIITVLILAVLIYIAFFWSNTVIKKRLPIKFEEHVTKYAMEYELDKYLVYSIICAESGFDREAESHVGAKGLMQLMPETAIWLNEKYKLNIDAENLFDAQTNIKLGCCYLSYLLERFDNEIPLVLAAYNGGEGNVKKWLNNEKYSKDGKTLYYIPYEETRNYVKKVSTYFELYKDIYG